MKKFIEIIRKSIQSPDGKESSTRIAFYILLIIIILMIITFFIMAFLEKIIPNELLIVFGSVLTQQLAMFGINKNFESKVSNKKEDVI